MNAVAALNAQGLQLLQAGLPGRREESWRFTPLRALERDWTVPATQPTTPAVPEFAQEGVCIVLCNGVIVSRPDQLPAGLCLDSLGNTPDGNESPAASGYVAALNAAKTRDGAVIRVTGNVEAPIHLVHLVQGDGVIAAPHHTIQVDGSATIIESFLGEGCYLANPVTRIQVAEAANLTHCRLQHDAIEAYHFGIITGEVAANATLHSVAVSLGAAVSRTEIDMRMTAPGAHVGLHGLYSVRGKQIADFHTSLDHAHPDCTSDQLYKGVLDDQGRGIFAGRIVVQPDAQRTAAEQTNRALLLSDDAHVNSMPQLEIFADDVRCTHGATVGELDEKALFYMRARGIGEAKARSILTYAFADEAIASLGDTAVRRYIESQLAGHAEDMTL